MKKKSFIKFMLLAVMLVVGSGMTRADVITITGADMTTTDGSQSITKAGVGFDGKMKQYQTTKIWFTSGSGYIYNTTSLGSITKITLSYNDGGSATSVQRFNVGSASMTSYMSSGGTTVSNSTGGTSYDYTGGVGYGYFNISVSSKNLQLVSLVIEYTPSSSCTPLGTPTVTTTAGNTEATLSWGAVANASSYTLIWNGGSPETVTSPVTKTGLTNGVTYSYSVMAVGDGTTYCETNTAATGDVTPVAPPPPAAPIATAATSVTSSGFTANWNAVSGATGYRLDVYTGSVSEVLNTSFEGSTSFPDEWTQNSSYVNNSSADAYAGTYFAGMNAANDYFYTPILSSPQIITFWVKASSATANNTVKVQYSSNSVDWSDLATFNANGSNTGSITNSYSEKTINANLTGNYYIRWFMSARSGGSAYFDVISITGGSQTYVSGFENHDAENVLTKAVTGLDASTEYFYVVRAYNANGPSENSNEITATTTAGSTPNITVSETTLSGFTYAQGSGPSAEQSFTVSGVNLTNDISIAATTNYEISKTSGSGYTTPLTFTHSGGTVTEQTVYVRLKSGLTQGTYNDEVINITSDGATTKTVTASGSVTAAPIAEPSNHATGFTATTNSTTEITVTWTDASGGADSYLVKGSSVSAESITAPVDGTAEADAALVKNIASGVQSATFTGLTASTTYYFNIYPYNGTSTSINYKVDGSVPTSSEATATPLAAATATAATAVSTTGFTANWVAVNGATSYDVNVYTKEGDENASDLFISEYFEGASGTNKAIELYNGTGSNVDLSNYSLRKQTNGAGIYKDELVLSGILENNEVYVIIANSSDYAGIIDNSDLSTTSACVNFNGNDAIGLFKNGNQIDEVGIFNQTTDWGKDVALIRNSNISEPKAIYDANDWTAVAGGTNAETTNLGSHTFSSGSTNTPITNSPFNVTSATTKELTGLSSGTAYYYTVVAKDATSSSDASNEITVITAIDGTLDASTLPDCPTCDLVVNNGGVVTLNAGKSYNSVSVKPGAKLTLNNGHAFAPGIFVLESDATATATFVDKRSNANKTNITATVKRHLPAAVDRTWWYLASPVVGASYTVFGSNKVGDYSEADRNYSNPFSAPTTLVAGKGYVVKMTAAEATDYIFADNVLNTGNISVPLTRTVTETADNAKRGFNLVGNPYPSYLNWDMAYNASTNIRSTIWYRTLNGASMEFHTYNATLGASVPSSASGYVPPMQAFWVKVNTDPVYPATVSNGTLNFTNDMRSHDESVLGNPLKTPANNIQLIRLSISNGTLSDETVIATHPSASDSYDPFDSEKMANGDANRPEIFSMAGNQELVINGISPLSDSKQITLGVRPGLAGNYTISLTEWRNTGDMEVVLRDNQLDEELILTESSSYSFDTDGNANTSRFSLLFRAKGSTTGFDRISSDLLIYSIQNTIRVESASLEGNTVSIFNALGQPIFSGKVQSNRLEINGLTPAVYMVKVNNQTKMVVVK